MSKSSKNSRKRDHLIHAFETWKNPIANGFDCIKFAHNALPEVDYDQSVTRVQFLRRSFEYPLMITAMTGGLPELAGINRVLGTIAAKYQIPVEVGSQRVAVEDPTLRNTFSAIRDNNPDGFVIANLGMAQLSAATNPLDIATTCIDMTGADAISIHLNIMQELLQPEGNHAFAGVLEKIQTLGQQLGVPVLVKEVGGGISGPTAARLEGAGVSSINVAGAGGTNFNKIEMNRALAAQYNGELEEGERQRTFSPPWDDLVQWGIPTPVSIRWVRSATSLPLVGSGGIRSGVDLAKVLCLGATLGGISGSLVPPLCTGFDGEFSPPTTSAECDRAVENLTGFLDQFLHQFKITLTCLGCGLVQDLPGVPLFYFGIVKEWLENLGLWEAPANS